MLQTHVYTTTLCGICCQTRRRLVSWPHLAAHNACNQQDLGQSHQSQLVHEELIFLLLQTQPTKCCDHAILLHTACSMYLMCWLCFKSMFQVFYSIPHCCSLSCTHIPSFFLFQLLPAHQNTKLYLYSWIAYHSMGTQNGHHIVEGSFGRQISQS